MKRKDLHSWNKPSNPPHPSSPLPCIAFLMQPAFSLGPCPNSSACHTAGWITGIGYSRHATGTLSLPTRSGSPLPLNPLGVAGAAQRSQQRREGPSELKASWSVHSVLQSTEQHISAFICTSILLPSWQCCSQLAARTKTAPSLPAHTQGNPCSGTSLCYRHQSVRWKKMPQGTCFLQHVSCLDDKPQSLPCPLLYHLHASTLSTASPKAVAAASGWEL